ncbi:MAG: hypothetical protein ABJN34_03485 [Litoreibacter sp.]|uniref:hypothetical protein n=1 Tax=Litoreibacter sp. TaxID=1969459 RepID=UPI0032984C50
MKETFEDWKMRFQLALYAVLAFVVISLVVYPPFVAKRVGDTFKALAANGLNFQVVNGKVSIAQSEGQLEAIETAAKFDEVRLNAVCLVTEDCSDGELETIIQGLSIKGVASYQTVSGTSAAGFPEWVVVVGADRTIEAARYELQKISNKNGVEDAGLVLRDGWYRTVAYFHTSEAAKLALPGLEEIVGNEGAYIRSLTLWCEGEIEKKDAEVVTCG